MPQIHQNGAKVPKRNVQIMGVKNEMQLRRSLVKHLKPILQVWSQQKLSSEMTVYGIRRYLQGAWLSLHVDRLPTHVFSAILQVTYINALFLLANALMHVVRYLLALCGSI